MMAPSMARWRLLIPDPGQSSPAGRRSSIVSTDVSLLSCPLPDVEVIVSISSSPPAEFTGGVRADICHPESLRGGPACASVRCPRCVDMHDAADPHPALFTSPPATAVAQPPNLHGGNFHGLVGRTGEGHPSPPPLLVLCCPAACQPSPWVSPSPSHDFSHVPQLEKLRPLSPVPPQTPNITVSSRFPLA